MNHLTGFVELDPRVFLASRSSVWENTEDLASSATAAFPSPTDSVEYVAPKLSARLLDTHGADPYPMTGH